MYMTSFARHLPLACTPLCIVKV